VLKKAAQLSYRRYCYIILMYERKEEGKYTFLIRNLIAIAVKLFTMPISSM